MKLRQIILILSLGTIIGAEAQNPVAKYEIIDTPDFPTSDLCVATVNAIDYDIDNTGQQDCTAKVQKLLDFLADDNLAGGQYARNDYRNRAGGVLYLPAGIYRFEGRLVIPRGVSIRGDWKKPVKGEPIEGTIFKIIGGRQTGAGTTSESSAFITMLPSTLVEGISFWYPDNSDLAHIRKFPPTILYGQSGYFGNDYCNTRHCTFVNSYIGIKFSTTNGGGCPNVFDVYGTPLSEGVIIDCIADVGRNDWLSFSPAYWAGSGLEGAPSEPELAAYLKQHATGFVMRRNDWSYTCNYTCESYHVGFFCDATPSSVTTTSGSPNGHNYGFEMKDCEVGVRVSAASGAGIMFTRVNTPGCQTGFELTEGAQGPITLYDCHLQGTSYGVLTTSGSGSPLHMTECQVDGEANILGGQFNSMNCSYTGNVFISAKARTIFTGNTVGGVFENKSIFECSVDDAVVELPPLPEYKTEWMEIPSTKPSGRNLFVATDFGASPVSYDGYNQMQDCSSAIQQALDAAFQAGGGVVYLPAGRYRMDGNLTIPEGVELKGASDLASIPRGQGAIFEVFVGEGESDGPPFITMSKNSGLRGVTIDYPVQDDPCHVRQFPYSVRGNEGVYIVNLGLRTACRGVDLFTHKCDNHYVDYVSGHCFYNVLRVGGSSQHGTVSNIQCNTIAYACGDETKFGVWHNSKGMADSKDYDYGKDLQNKAYGQNKEDLDFLIVGDCEDEVLYNNFLFGCHKGIWFVNDGQGGASHVRSLGNAVDGALYTFVFDEAATDVDLINSQVVAINHTGDDVVTAPAEAYFYLISPKWTHRLHIFSSDNWGGGNYFAKVDGGEVCFVMPNLAASGSAYTFQVAEGAKVKVAGGVVQNGGRFSYNNSEPRLSVCSSFLDARNASLADMAVYENNLKLIWNFTDTSVLKGRSGWKATAFNDPTGYGDARYAIDGNTQTRWSTNRAQTSGDWFAVDFGSVTEFNAIVIDDNNSPGDQPADYTLQIWRDEGWQTVKEGKGSGSYMIIALDEPVSTQKIQLTEHTTKSNGYWSIHEIYIASLDLESSGISIPYAYSDSADVSVKVYSLSGIQQHGDLKQLPRGIYVVRTEQRGKPVQTHKIVIR